LLGEASIKLDDLTALFFGPETLSKARQRRSIGYSLTLAQMPRESSQSGDGGADATLHPLVGKPAPQINLKMLSGDSFQLSQQKGHIVVLDFWASWCGPCMQTMPKLEQLVDEIGSERVQLVAVNIQEARTRIELALERINVNCSVAMDVDGEVAAAYSANAIPQTVIVDAEGGVSHVFVGGGEQTLEQIRAAIQQMLAKQVE
jgi:thiol-disulfide isomerase/thioredoxin